jgi:hypothetical protein
LRVPTAPCCLRRRPQLPESNALTAILCSCAATDGADKSPAGYAGAPEQALIAAWRPTASVDDAEGIRFLSYRRHRRSCAERAVHDHFHSDGRRGQRLAMGRHGLRRLIRRYRWKSWCPLLDSNQHGPLGPRDFKTLLEDLTKLGSRFLEKKAIKPR